MKHVTLRVQPHLVARRTRPHAHGYERAVLLEAGRYAKPVVGRNVPVLQELLRAGEAALLVGQLDPTRNKAALSPTELAVALLVLIADPQECRRLGENCQLVSEELLWRDTIQRYEKSYELTLDRFKHGQRSNQPILERAA